MTKSGIFNIVLVLLTLAFSFGCNTSRKLACDPNDHVSGWCKGTRDVALKSWKYAQLSKNVYHKPFQFDLEKHFDKIEDFPDTALDFFATLYREKANNLFVFVFRGTDSSKDFRTGNNPFCQKQNRHALEIYDKAKKRLNFDTCVVAGHSLGGGIAIHISLNRERATAFSFNGSPVFRNTKKICNRRFSIVEYGEVLKLARILGREANQLYTSIGCSRGNMIEQHDMKSLALCLTQIAATESNDATESLVLNGVIKK